MNSSASRRAPMSSRQAEQNANNALGALLSGMMPTYAVRVENTRVIVDNSGLRLDILITAPDRAPVVLEAEFMPAADVEQEAKDRLGLEVVDGRRPIEAAIALRYPEGLEFSGGMSEAMRDARLEYAVFHRDRTRFPESGWLDGSPADLAELARLVSVPQEAVNSAADALQDGIESAVAVLDDMAMLRPAITRAIADLLGMSDVRQTRRMALRHHSERHGLSRAAFRYARMRSSRSVTCAETASRTRRMRRSTPGP